MNDGSVSDVREKISLELKCLPQFAAYILHHALEDFVTEIRRHYEAIDVPVLRFFKSMGDDQLNALATASAREMLTLIASGKTSQYIEQSINSWINNQLPVVTSEQIHSQDITLVNYAKARVFRLFIPRYTDDSTLYSNLVDELERFVVILNTELFSSFIQLQNERINKINAELKKREVQLLEAQEIGQVGSFEWDLIGKQSTFTPQMFKIFEMDGPSNLVSFLHDVHPDERQKVKDSLEKAMADGDYECEYRYVKNNKEKVILSRGKVQFEDGKPARMIGTVTDVTERHNIIKKLQESEKLHKQAQALTHIGNWSWQVAENKVRWSDEMYRIYGLEPQSEEITYERFLSFVHPDDLEGRIAEIRRSLETGEVEEYHFKITDAKGVAKVLRGKGEIITDRENKPVVMLGTCQDVTKEYTLTKQLQDREKYLEELNNSLQAANEELTRANQELESFNFIASHDLQEPLRKIQVYSNRILENGVSQLPPPLQDYFSRINKASSRMQRLIEDFLAFSQTLSNPQLPEPVDVNAILEEIKQELGTRIEEKQAAIEAGPLPRITGVPFQVKQLMTNLISNALKYNTPGVNPRIVIEGTIVKGSEVAHEAADRRLSYVKISVADNGIGFDPKYSVKIFELFQRLHSTNVYSGTGIGLALCKKIVQNMKGVIVADSVPGKGSVFTFYIPVASR